MGKVLAQQKQGEIVRRTFVSWENKFRDAQLRANIGRWMRQISPELPLSVAAICDKLGESRGRPINLVEWELPPQGPFGILISRAEEDVIAYQAKTTKTHQDHIILHEVGHLLAHDIAGRRAPGIRRRTGYSDRDERDAEIIASTIMHHTLLINQHSRRYDLDAPWQASVYNSLVLSDGTP